MIPPFKYFELPGTLVMRCPIRPPVHDSARPSFMLRAASMLPTTASMLVSPSP
jgi:hypothetical protein